jgi:hypothetical protein
MNNNKEVYVVTRNGRRTEEANYKTKEEAKERQKTLIQTLKKWKDSDAKRVKVEKTSLPRKIK